jgi:hypothetical protein
MTTLEQNGHVTHEHQSAFKTWIIITLILLFIVFKDVLSLLVVGDLGQPDWDYRPMPDVPGESAYAIYPSMPHSQHILGKEGE